MTGNMVDRKDIDIIPGTEVVFKENGTAVGHDGDDELVLVPRPSSNPDDPLNWSKTWKTVVIANQFVFVFVSILTPLAIAPLTLLFEAEFHKTLPQVNMLFGAAAITLGYANLLIVPAANVFGRRPVILLCGLVCILANVWQALVTSYPSFLAARVVSGIGAAANESIMPMVVSDLLFVHQRGTSMTFYFWAYFMGLFIGPIISGAIASQINWRWFFWVCTILQAASWLFTLVAHPETKYERSTSALSSVRGSDVDVVALEEMKKEPEETAATAGDGDNAAPSASSASSSGSQAAAAAEGPPPRPSTAASAAPPPPPSFPHYRVLGRPSRAQFALVPRARFHYTGAQLARDAAAPLRIFAYPIVLWASLAMGFAANCLLGLNLTQAQVFGAPPYRFSPAQIGYVNFAFVGGAAVALATAGPYSDWLALRRARRRHAGVLEAEFRLPALWPFVAANAAGMAVAAVGYQRAWPWEAIVVCGYALVGAQVVGVPAIAIAYAVDCYKALPGEIMIAATIIKNTFGFGMIFFFNDWAATDGYLSPVLTLMALAVGFAVLGLLVFVPYGKAFRRMTKDSKLHAL